MMNPCILPVCLINLWWPSICQRTRGDWTLCCLLLTATLQCCITLMGSALKRDCLILSCCTQCPLLCSNPFTILITIFGWDCCADVTKSSSSHPLIWLNIPETLRPNEDILFSIFHCPTPNKLLHSFTLKPCSNKNDNFSLVISNEDRPQRPVWFYCVWYPWPTEELPSASIARTVSCKQLIVFTMSSATSRFNSILLM